MTKREEKILRELDKLINGLKDNQPTSSGIVGTMQESTNSGMIIGLETAKKVIMLQ